MPVRVGQRQVDRPAYGVFGTPVLLEADRRALSSHRELLVKIWVGLDVAQKQTQVCTIDDKARVQMEGLVATDADEVAGAILSSSEVVVQRIVMEAGMGRRLALHLRAKGFDVEVIDTRKARKFLAIRLHKSDKNDARGLAELALLGMGEIRDVHVKSLECQRLRSELVLRSQVVKQRASLQAAIRSLLVDNGIVLKLPRGAKMRAVIEEALAPSNPMVSEHLRRQAMPLLDLWDGMRRYVEASDRRLKSIALANPIMMRLMGVPGVGFICAISFYTAIDNPDRFKRATDVGPYLGMVPAVAQSGTVIRRTKITKAGSKLTRSHLVAATRVLVYKIRQDSALADWSRALTARIGYSRAKVAIARKIAVLLLALWKSGEDFTAYPTNPQLPRETAGLDAGHISGASTQNQEAVPSLL